MTALRQTKKILSIILTASFFFQPIVPVYAQEDATSSAETAVVTDNPEPSPSPDPTPNPTPDPSPTLPPPAATDNSATVSATVSSTADTGNNTQIASDSAVVTQTGSATAVANNLNQVNIQAEHSTLVADIVSPPASTSAVDLASIPAATPAAAPVDTLNNSASLTAATAAIATTGNNIAITAASAELITQNAIAIANAINLINLSLQDSDVVIFIANIDANSDSIIILPRPELYQGPYAADTTANLVTYNQADVLNLIGTTTNTGNNVTISSGTNQITTGNAYALTQQFDLINTLIQDSSYYFMTVNHPLTTFTTPLHQTNLTVTDSSLQTSWSTGSINPTPIASPNTSVTDNQAVVSNNVTAYANTGSNTVVGSNVSLITGVSVAIANSIQFINTQIIHSRIFIGIINFLGLWTGSAHFNYPDVTIIGSTDRNQINSGDSITYHLSITNQGYDIAHHPRVTVSTPQGRHTYSVNDLQPNQTQSLAIPLTLSGQPTQTITLSADVVIDDPEINHDNNITASQLTFLNSTVTVMTPPTTSEEPGPSAAHLTITAANNVIDPMRPGDTITFEVNLANDSDYPATNTMFTHVIYNHNGAIIGQVAIPLGTIQPHRSGTLHFGITIPGDNSWGSGFFYTNSQATCDSYTTDIAITKFSIQSTYALVKTAFAADDTNYPLVLGQSQSDTAPPSDSSNPPLIAYLLVFFMSLQYILRHTKIANPLHGFIYLVILFIFFFSVYQIATISHLIQPITSIDNNYLLLEGRLRQFL